MSPQKNKIWIILYFCTLNHGLHAHVVDVGIVLDMESWVGKSIYSYIMMAVLDFYACNDSYRTKIVVHARDSKGDPLQAMSNVLDLLNTVKVSAIIGPETYIGSKLVTSITDDTKVPIFTFAGKASMEHTYIFQIKEDEFAMTRGIAALVELFKWRDVIFVYEDNDHGPGILEHLFESFQDKNIRIVYRSVISSSATNDQVTEELRKLMHIQTSVIIVNVSPLLASSIFPNAKMLGMMSKEYAWILTQKTIEIMHSTNFQVIDSLQGALAFRSFIPMSSKMHNLKKRWHDEFSREPPMLAVWAYDTTWALAESIERVEIPQNGSMLLSEILNMEFQGASGEFRLSGNKLASNGYEIINAIDYGERKVGYWTVSNGIRRVHLPFNDNLRHSNEIEDVIWPGGSTTTPKGWISRIRVGKTLRIGVRTGLSFKYFVDAYYDSKKNKTTATGFSVDVFNACIHGLPYEVPYEFIPFAAGSYDYLINKVYNQELDGVLGDSTILASRAQYVDFTAAYTDVGIGTLIRLKEKNSWMFLKRLDVDLWLTYVVFGILAILPLWAIYVVNHQEHETTITQQIGTIASLILLSIFLAQRERLLKNLSRFMMFVWVVVVFGLFKQSYTATQTSLSSVEQVELASKHGVVGFHDGSFFGFLKFTDNMQNPYHSYEDYADALSRGGKHGGADAIVDEVPYIKMFLRKYPHHEYAMILSKPVTSGFGFIFTKGSPLVIDMSREIARIREDGTLMNLENKWFGKDFSLSFPTVETPNLFRFWGLFIVIGVSLALVFTVSALYLVRAKMELGTIISFLAGQSLAATVTNLWTIISFPARQSLVAIVKNIRYSRIIRR